MWSQWALGYHYKAPGGQSTVCTCGGGFVKGHIVCVQPPNQIKNKVLCMFLVTLLGLSKYLFTIDFNTTRHCSRKACKKLCTYCLKTCLFEHGTTFNRITLNHNYLFQIWRTDFHCHIAHSQSLCLIFKETGTKCTIYFSRFGWLFIIDFHFNDNFCRLDFKDSNHNFYTFVNKNIHTKVLLNYGECLNMFIHSMGQQGNKNNE